MRKKVLIVVSGLICAVLLIPFSAHAEFYKWVDDQGDVHFTDQYANIPEKYRPFVETRKTPIESPPPTITGKPPRDLTPESSELAEEEASVVFRGMISEIDKDARTILVAGTVRTTVFPVPEDTRIRTEYGNHILFADLRTGMWVSVEYVQNGEDIRTLNIRVEATPTSFQNARREGEKEKYKEPKYEPPEYESPTYERPEHKEPKYDTPKYKGLKYIPPKYQRPKYQGSKK